MVQDCIGYAVSFNERHRGGGWRVLSTHVTERRHGNCDRGQEVSCVGHCNAVLPRLCIGAAHTVGSLSVL